ncbi:MAG: hypothetical protein LC791_19285 [Acidobacteria bacterium]|nr:hypothetical protein [Acidobacteriota bacterium]
MASVLVVGASREVSADWALTAFLGGSHTRDSSLTLTRPSAATDVTLARVRYDGASFEAPPYYGYRLAFFPRSSWFGIEGELIHLKVIADTSRMTSVEGIVQGDRVNGEQPIASLIQRFSITHGVNLVLVNAVARRPLRWRTNDDRPSTLVVGRLGLGGSVPHPESAIDGIAYEGYEWGALSTQAAAGVERRLAGPLYVVAEYKLSRSVQRVTIAGGSARTPLVTHHLVGGLVAYLGPHSRRTE